MPTSGAGAPSTASVKATAAFWKSGVSQPTLLRLTGTGGGQSDPLLSRALLPGPERGASSSARWFGLRSGLTGKSKAEDGRARRRAAKPVGVGEGKERNTGDIAHLETRRVFRLLFAMSRTIFAWCSLVVFPKNQRGVSLAACTASLAARQVWITSCLRPSRSAAASTRSLPIPTAKAPAAKNSAALVAFTPPVGMK